MLTFHPHNLPAWAKFGMEVGICSNIYTAAVYLPPDLFPRSLIFLTTFGIATPQYQITALEEHATVHLSSSSFPLVSYDITVLHGT